MPWCSNRWLAIASCWALTEARPARVLTSTAAASRFRSNSRVAAFGAEPSQPNNPSRKPEANCAKRAWGTLQVDDGQLEVRSRDLVPHYVQPLQPRSCWLARKQLTMMIPRGREVDMRRSGDGARSIGCCSLRHRPRKQRTGNAACVAACRSEALSLSAGIQTHFLFSDPFSNFWPIF